MIDKSKYDFYNCCICKQKIDLKNLGNKNSYCIAVEYDVGCSTICYECVSFLQKPINDEIEKRKKIETN